MLKINQIDLKKEYPSVEEELKAAKSYIYQLVEELRYRLDDGDSYSSSDDDSGRRYEEQIGEAARAANNYITNIAGLDPDILRQWLNRDTKTGDIKFDVDDGTQNISFNTNYDGNGSASAAIVDALGRILAMLTDDGLSFYNAQGERTGFYPSNGKSGSSVTKKQIVLPQRWSSWEQSVIVPEIGPNSTVLLTLGDANVGNTRLRYIYYDVHIARIETYNIEQDGGARVVFACANVPAEVITVYLYIWD